METPKTKDAETPIKPDKIDEFTAQLVSMKAFFMIGVCELINEIARLKEASLNVGNSFSKENLKYHISLLQRENTFIKTELNNKQHITKKLLNINSIQSNVTDISVTDNAHINENHSVFENSSKNKGNPSENFKHQNRNGKPDVDFNKINSPRKTVTVIGDSIKYLRSENLSSKNYEVKIVEHPGSTTKDLIDYVKPIVRKKTHFSVIHSGTNDLTNGVNTIKEIRKIVKCVRDLDKDKVTFGFSSVISRSERNLGQEIRDLNLKLKRYCEGNNFLFVDKVNIEESCLNNSKFHLNHKGNNI